MKAIAHDRFGPPGDVLGLRDVDKPVIDADDAVLVKVHAASVNPLDWHMITGAPYIARIGAGLRRPKQEVPGADVAGTVEAVGADVTRFQPGDEVFGRGSTGSFAEFALISEKRTVLKPSNITFEQAATVPIAALTALQGLRDKGKLQAGQKVLINGASGGVGTFAVQIAKSFGAEVTGVCSTRNVDMLRSIGADHVIDYTTDDFTQSDERYDVLLDNQGNHSLRACKGVLTAKGIYVPVGGSKKGRFLGPMKRLAGAPFVFLFSSQKATMVMTQITQEDLLVMAELLESGKVVPVIDRCYDLAQTPEAMEYLGQGHAQGKIIIVP